MLFIQQCVTVFYVDIVYDVVSLPTTMTLLAGQISAQNVEYSPVQSPSPPVFQPPPSLILTCCDAEGVFLNFFVFFFILIALL